MLSFRRPSRFRTERFARSRLRRITAFYAGLLALAAYVLISVWHHRPIAVTIPSTSDARAAIKGFQDWRLAGQKSDRTSPDPSRSDSKHHERAAAPGFEDALPSCRVWDLPNDTLTKQYGQNNLRLSRTYEGSGTRVRKLLQKVRSGRPIKISVVGGSVSTGHGVAWPYTSETFMYLRIQQWFQDTFPQSDISLNRDSAIPATTAWYFSYCVLETLPEDSDLVLMELDINHHDSFADSLKQTEALYRTILSMESQPALIYISVFGLIFEDMTHGWRHSALVSQWLDVPEINIRNFYLRHLMDRPEEKPVIFKNWADEVDTRHMNKQGHKATADMVIAYLREQLCLLERDGPFEQEPDSNIWPGNSITVNLPRLGMLSKWDDTTYMPTLHPECASITSTKHPLRPLRMQGWQAVDRNDKKSFEATEPGAEIDFKVNVSEGRLGIYFWLSKDPMFGNVVCFVDGDDRPENLRWVFGHNANHWASTFEHSGDLWTNLSPGEHIMTCRLVAAEAGGHVFRISATIFR